MVNIKILIIAILILLAFSYGVISGHYKLPPFNMLKTIKNIDNKIAPTINNNQDYFDSMFIEPLPDTNLLYEPIENKQQLLKHIDKLKVIKNNEFFEIYNNIQTSNKIKYINDIYYIDYFINEMPHKAYSYFFKSTNNNDCGYLLVVGSGDDRSVDVANEVGLHGTIKTTVTEYCDLYVMIKPNQGFRSIHNGEKRISEELYIIATLLNEDYSYSTTYLTEAVAWFKFIEESYSKSGIIGLSQGARASVLLSLQAEPDFVIASSGFSIQQMDLYYADSEQIIIPNIHNYYNKTNLENILSEHQTNYFLSYGKNDSRLYKLEYNTNHTCNFFKQNVQNVTCINHQMGHVFPEKEISMFLEYSKLN